MTTPFKRTSYANTHTCIRCILIYKGVKCSIDIFAENEINILTLAA